MGKGIRFALLISLLPLGVFAQNGGSFGVAPKSDTVPQKDLTDVIGAFFKMKAKPATSMSSDSKVYFSFLPTATSVPGGGKAFITSTTAGFYLGDRETTNLSNVSFTPYFNLQGRFGLPLRSSIWLKNNKWFIAGDTRLMVYPQDTWGLGGDQPEENKTGLDYKYVRFYQSVLRRIKPYFLAGFGYAMDYHIRINTKDQEANLQDVSDYTFGTAPGQNSFSSGVTFNLLYDTRNNSINPMPGCYANFIYRYNTPALGSNRTWQSVYLDMRKYVALSHGPVQNTLAFWSYYWSTFGGGTPYLSLPSIGWDVYNRSGRGIEQNRYRGSRLAYFETEYRRGITRNGLLGFVLFANTTSVTEPETNKFKYFHPAGGAGLRIKFNKKSNTNIAIDYGVSKGFSSIRLNLGEAF
ncbi:BamA/TamA family outer membrane protein [Mucilaginibacter lacusdianchii]|uniref:BamA/TamA family outer membrane protein n=1 Tax=Mucilaginibacter lacusdianchii TaxID=2684211 RepID=UPI00131C042D|nr:BamA/TamA family outer membrane protein [Mucilaginibacter sp. JXJ CY 39]